MNGSIVTVFRENNLEEITFKLRSVNCKFSLKRDFLSWIRSRISPKASPWKERKRETRIPMMHTITSKVENACTQ